MFPRGVKRTTPEKLYSTCANASNLLTIWNVHVLLGCLYRCRPVFGFTYVKALVLIILLWHAQEFLFQVKKIEKCNLKHYLPKKQFAFSILFIAHRQPHWQYIVVVFGEYNGEYNVFKGSTMDTPRKLNTPMKFYYKLAQMTIMKLWNQIVFYSACNILTCLIVRMMYSNWPLSRLHKYNTILVLEMFQRAAVLIWLRCWKQFCY